MDSEFAMRAFSAMSQETRLDVFKLLMSAGPVGMTASELSERLDVRQNTMSTNLTILLNADLVRREREGRSVRYFISLDGVKRLLTYFLEDCCGSSADVHKPLLNDMFDFKVSSSKKAAGN